MARYWSSVMYSPRFPGAKCGKVSPVVSSNFSFPREYARRRTATRRLQLPPADRPHPLLVPLLPGDPRAVREEPLPGPPHGPMLAPAAAELVQLDALHLERLHVPKCGAPRLDPPLLHRLPLVGAVEHVEVEQIVDQELLDLAALRPHVATLGQPLAEQLPRFALVLGVRRFPPARLSREPVQEPPHARGAPVASLGTIDGARRLASASSHLLASSRVGRAR